jgi:hypothetical protein
MEGDSKQTFELIVSDEPAIDNFWVSVELENKRLRRENQFLREEHEFICGELYQEICHDYCHSEEQRKTIWLDGQGRAAEGRKFNHHLDNEKPSLQELWRKVLDCIELPGILALLESQTKLISFDYDLIDNALVVFNKPRLVNRHQRIKAVVVAAFHKLLGVDVNVEFMANRFTFQSSPPFITEDCPERSQRAKLIEEPVSRLTDDQESALSKLKQWMNSRETLFRLEGYAGTGKSFLICEFIKWLNQERISYLAASPTNKAAKNLRSIATLAGLDLEVKTVAQILGQQPELNVATGEEEFVSNGSKDFGDYQVIIIDEFSMVNRENFSEIINEAHNNICRVLFVGDRAQLPPIKEKEPMAATYQMPSATLNKIVRYDGEIARVAEAIRTNLVTPVFNTTADKTIVCLPDNEWLRTATEFFESAEYKANPDHVRFLAWRNRTVEALNNYVRLHLWGESALSYVPGDRLIARKPLFRAHPGSKGKNKWRIFINNSEEATVTQEAILTELKFNREIYQYWQVMVQPEMGTEQKLMILHENSKDLHAEKVREYASKKQWSAYFDLSRTFDDIGYGYALTTHKAQGSSIEHVFLDAVDMKHSGDRQKLLYTALTRTKKQAFILN